MFKSAVPGAKTQSSKLACCLVCDVVTRGGSRGRLKPSFNDFAIRRHPHASSGVVYIDFVQDDAYCLKRPAVCNDKHGLRAAQLQVCDQRLNAREQSHERFTVRRSGSGRRMSNESLKFVTGLLFECGTDPVFVG